MLVDWGLVRIMDLTATRLRACVYGTLMSTFFSPFAGLDFGAPEHDDRGAHGICLPSAFVFDTLGTTEVARQRSRFLVTSLRDVAIRPQSGTDCSGGFMPECAKSKPGVLVPSSVFERPESWEALAVAMLGKAYGYGEHGTMSVTDVVAPAGGENNRNSSATCFRSVLTSEFKVMEFSREWSIEASILFSANSIKKLDSASSADAAKHGSCSFRRK
jgi:hypothetical protein